MLGNASCSTPNADVAYVSIGRPESIAAAVRACVIGDPNVSGDCRYVTLGLLEPSPTPSTSMIGTATNRSCSRSQIRLTRSSSDVITTAAAPQHAGATSLAL